MAALILPSRRVWQPQGPVEVDHSNPDSAGLLLAVNHAAGMVNLARRGVITPSGTPGILKARRSGFQLESFAYVFSYTPPTALTAATIYSVESLAGDSGGPWRTNETENDFAPFSDGNIYLNTFASSRYISGVPFASYADRNGFVVAARGSGVANSHAAFINGRKIGTANSAFVCNPSIQFGSNGYSSGSSSALRLLFDRAHTDEQVARISRNPWALFRPIQRRIMVAVSSGGGPTAYTLTADVGSYSLTGQDAALKPTFKRTLVADAASYSLTGQDALLSYIPGGVDYSLPADTGSYSLTGQDANFAVVRNYALAADAGSYTLNGQDAILAYAPGSGAYVLAADVGTYTSTGRGAATRFNARVDGSTGTYSSTAQGAALTVARRLPGAAGTYQITGNDATLTFVGVMAYTLSGETGTYTLNGSPATLTGPSDVSTRRGGWAPEMPRRKKERVDRILDDVLAVLEEQKEPERVVRRAKKTLHRVARAEQVQNLAELDTKVDLAEVEDAVTRVIHKAIKEAKVKRRRKQDEELLLML